MMKVKSFGWIMVWWEVCLVWGIMRNVSEMYLNGLKLVDKYENVDIGWKCEVGMIVNALCRKKDYLC